MTEEEEILRFGTIMYRVDKHGNKERVPRELWDATYDPAKMPNPPASLDTKV